MSRMRNPFRVTVCFCLLVGTLSVASRADDFQGSMHLTPFDEDTIAYSKTQDSSAIAGLKTRIEMKVSGSNMRRTTVICEPFSRN
jgi:hypothetical protein